MSFREDYEAAMLEEQRAKDAVNEARRAHKAAKERLEKMHGYAKEFERLLNSDKPASTDADKAAKPTEPDGEKPSGTDSSEPREPDNSDESAQN
ncbi:hypothetical protein I4J23_10600 [Corynebacterium diphtheriae bv. mitis]|uniref:hypothetical protein n=1 Tax=Corynebacterium diphtheriae TaxID=1717 RepID=UPI0018CBA0F9|nr:hypothetical protein [Corynebacterium diphtheriae]MBG9304245.1 hypothetical protein [Corynebacterium diphtheriae bv. mitis]